MDNWDPYFDIAVYYIPNYTTEKKPRVENKKIKEVQEFHLRMIRDRKELGKTIELITLFFRAVNMYLDKIIID